MQSKRSKRTRIRAAKPTSCHGHKKKNRGAGHRGGRGKAGSGKRGSFKIMKVTDGKKYLGKSGFKSLKKKQKAINLHELQTRLDSLLEKKLIYKSNGAYEIDLAKLGYSKLLSKGDVFYKMNIKAEEATNLAKSKIEEKGGNIKIIQHGFESGQAGKVEVSKG